MQLLFHLKKRAKIYKVINIFTMFVLTINMSLSGIFIFATQTKAESSAPYIITEKSAVSSTCEQAEIDLKITGSGDPINERKPIDVVFVIDRSSSMEGSYLSNVKTAVKSFIDQMDFSSGDPDRVGVVSYSGYSDSPSSIDYPFGSNGANAKSAVDGIEAGGGTCIECGLRKAYGMLNGSREQYVILLSDGVANVKDPGTHNIPNVCNWNTLYMDCPIVTSECIDNSVVWGSNIKNDHATTIYSIGYRLSGIDSTCSNSGQTSALAEQTLKNISSNPTDYYYSGDPSNINTIFNEIAYRINNIAGYDAKIVEVLPAGISFGGMISGATPSTINGQTITWEFGNISIDETKEVKFSVTSGASGHTGLIDVYPDTRVEYLDVHDQVNTVPFPETSLTIDSCHPTPTTGTIQGCKWEDDGDGVWTVGAGEPTIPAWGIELYNADSDTYLLATTSTYLVDSGDEVAGCYKFENIPFGTYQVVELQGDPSIWEQTYPKASTTSAVAYLGNYGHTVILSDTATSALAIDFGNHRIEHYTISGHKYEDQDGTTTTDEYLANPGEGWTVNLFDGTATTSTTTDSSGFFSFPNLVDGIYHLTEIIKSGWSQLFAPRNEIVVSDSDSTNNNFINYYPNCGNKVIDSGEECDDGNNISGDGCSETCSNEGGGGEVWCGDGLVNQSSEECDDGANNGQDGYCNSDCTTPSNGGGGGGGTPLCILQGNCGGNTTPTTPKPEEVVVLGEEGAPILTITKSVNPLQANPGDTLNYSVLITNNGNLEAYQVTLTDTLPEGLVFVENESNTYSWDLGDIPVGESRDANYKVRVSDDATEGTYTNTVVARADNHDDISATASVEVIVPVVLAETGMDFGELIFLFIFSITAIVTGRKLRLKSSI